MPITLQELQAQVDSWIQANGGYWSEFQILARLTEEQGEVAGALQRQAGLRPRKSDVNVADELGDLLFTLVVLANKLDIDLEETIAKVLRKYDVRDAEAWRTHLQNTTTKTE